MVIDKNWTLFLDRDGVINRRIPGGYVSKPGEFVFLPGVREAIRDLSKIFDRIIVVTNQQGIGKKIMTEKQLALVHHFMLEGIDSAGGRIDAIYHSPFLESDNNSFRKPGIGMALQAQHDFPEITFRKSIMVGDSASDIEFGKNAGMITVLVSGREEETQQNPDHIFDNLYSWAKFIMKYSVTE